MTESQEPPKILRNGFEAPTRQEIEHQSIMVMAALDNLDIIPLAIKRLAGASSHEFASLAPKDAFIAQRDHNDVDVMCGQAEEAGVLGELIEEDTRHE